MSADRPRLDAAQQAALDAALERIGAGEAPEAVLESVHDTLVAAEVRSLVAMHEAAEREGFMAQEASLPDPATSFAPRRIGRYSIEEILGAGASGTVYRAVQDAPRRAVALKVLDRTLAQPDARTRFDHEAAVLAALDHPGIARVLEAGKHEDVATPPGGVPFIAMELVEGAQPITTYAEAHGLDTEARIALFAAACDAIGHAHALGIVHRDLKPANLLVDAQGRVKVIDLGIARILDDGLGLATMHTAPGRVFGTLRYMSPEQADGAVESVDARSDVYALGVVLFELLCGEAPYDVGSTSLSHAVAVIREVPPVAPGAIDRTLRGDVERIVLTALAKDPEDRYADASALAKDLQRHAEHLPISAGGRARLPSRRQVLEIGGATIVLGVAIALTRQCQPLQGASSPPGSPPGAAPRRAPATIPATAEAHPRFVGAVAQDAALGGVLLLEADPEARAYLGPWRLRTEPARWASLAATHPVPRARIFAAVAAGGGRLVVFGGTDHVSVGDQLSWYDADGELRETTGANEPIVPWPSKREHASIAYDSARDRFLMTGGQFSERSGSQTYRDDAWWLEFTAAGEPSWRAVPAGPSARSRAALAYDPEADAFVLHGGQTGPGTGSSETWILDAATERWREVPPSADMPSAGGARSSAFDPTWSVVLLDPVGQLWSFREDGWMRVALPDPDAIGGVLVAHPDRGLLRVGHRHDGALAPDVHRFAGAGWVTILESP